MAAQTLTVLSTHDTVSGSSRRPKTLCAPATRAPRAPTPELLAARLALLSAGRHGRARTACGPLTSAPRISNAHDASCVCTALRLLSLWGSALLRWLGAPQVVRLSPPGGLLGCPGSGGWEEACTGFGMGTRPRAPRERTEGRAAGSCDKCHQVCPGANPPATHESPWLAGWLADWCPVCAPSNTSLR